jgi:hypothetical protein
MLWNIAETIISYSDFLLFMDGYPRPDLNLTPPPPEQLPNLNIPPAPGPEQQPILLILYLISLSRIFNYPILMSLYTHTFISKITIIRISSKIKIKIKKLQFVLRSLFLILNLRKARVSTPTLLF